MKLIGYFGEKRQFFFFNAFSFFFFLGISPIIVEKTNITCMNGEPPPARLAYCRGRVTSRHGDVTMLYRAL